MGTKNWKERFYDYSYQNECGKDGSVKIIAKRLHRAGLIDLSDQVFKSEYDLVSYLKSLDLPFNQTVEKPYKKPRWQKRVEKLFKDNGLETPDTMKEKARVLVENGVTHIDDFESRTEGQLKPEVLAIAKRHKNGQDISRGVTKTGSVKIKRDKKPKKRSGRKNNKDKFYNSWAWEKKRLEVLKAYGAYCMVCDRGREDGAVICVDHIYPRKKYPQLELEFDNLQVLCYNCNKGKSNDDYTDFREESRIRRERISRGLKPWESDP